MDSEVARRLFAEGAVLLLLGVPERTEIGVDYGCWRVGPRFKGVKMIPPGIHFVYYSAVSKEGHTAPRTGFFHFFQRQEVYVRHWDKRTEDFTDKDITPELIDRMRADSLIAGISACVVDPERAKPQNLRRVLLTQTHFLPCGMQDLDRCLGPYPFDSLEKWVSLTSHISEPLVRRLQPLNGIISSVTQLEGQEQPESSATGVTCDRGSEKAEKADDFTPGGIFAGVGEFPPTPRPAASGWSYPRLPEMNRKPEAAIRFSELPKQKYPVGSTPAEITSCNLDLSYTLESMLSNSYSGSEKDLLGELQFTFVCFLIGQVYDAFEHWKLLVKLLCSCEAALTSYPELFSGFISVLHFQLKEVPEDFFVDIISRDNFLTATLQVFFSNLEGLCSAADGALVRKGLQFRDSLTKKYKWDFSVEPEEFAPTVVET